MKKNIKKKLHEQGYLIVKNILNFKKDLKPVLNDMEFVMDCLIQKYARKKNIKKNLNLDFKKKYSYISKLNIQKVENVRSNKDRIVLFSNDIFMQLKIIREFLLNKMWRHPKVESSKKLGKKVISELFDLFFEKPKELFTFSLTLNKSSLISKNDKDLARLIVDKISSLTDRNALEIHKNYIKWVNYVTIFLLHGCRHCFCSETFEIFLNFLRNFFNKHFRRSIKNWNFLIINFYQNIINT